MDSAFWDWVRDKLSGSLLLPNTIIDTETTTEALSTMQAAGNSTGHMVVTAVSSGFVPEVVQPVMLSTEAGVDQYRKHRFDQTHGRNKPSWVRRILKFLDDL